MIHRLTYLDYSNTKGRNITTMMEGRYRADFKLAPRRSADNEELLQPDY